MAHRRLRLNAFLVCSLYQNTIFERPAYFPSDAKRLAADVKDFPGYAGHWIEEDNTPATRGVR